MAEDGLPEPGDNTSSAAPQDAPADDIPIASTKDVNNESNNNNNNNNGDDDEETEHEEEDEGEEDEEEPRLKYATLTRNLNSLYRNGDTTSSCLVIVGTHTGNVHVFSMPSLRTIKVFRPHAATVTSISISPLLPALIVTRPDATPRLAAISAEESPRSPQSSPNAKRSPKQPPVPRTPSNDIYIATSSIDGQVCISSLVDPEDVQLRNFARPVQAVALSPEYKSDRSYLSGGTAGQLVLTTGGQRGKSANATTTGAAATASSWLGSIGLGASSGIDKVLHSDEGAISTVKWSPSGKYVIWTNEHGVKIMRSNLHLSASETGQEWKRISHTDRPEAEEAVGVWKPRVEWVNRDNLEPEKPLSAGGSATNGTADKQVHTEQVQGVEEVLVGWGDQVWLFKIHPSNDKSVKHGNNAGTVSLRKLVLGDCVIAGLSLYTQNILIVLAYMEKKPKKKSSKSSDGSRKSKMLRQNGLKPELRLIDMTTREEVESDLLPVSRFETLTSSDYHLAILPPIKVPSPMAQRNYLGSIGSGVTAVSSGVITGVETVGQGVWDATMYGPRRLGVNRLFSSGESIKGGMPGKEPSPSIRERNYLTGWIPGFGSSVMTKEDEQLTSVAVNQGMKIFIYSPFDTVVAIGRGITDRLQWLIEMHRYAQAWELLNEHPEAAGTVTESPEDSGPPTPTRSSSVARSASTNNAGPSQPLQQNTLADFFADATSMTSSQRRSKDQYSSAEKEKRRIGELWLQSLVADKEWAEAGEVADKVLNTSTRWYYWVWKFISNKRFDEIAFHIPTFQITPPLPSEVFELVLGHYMSKDRRKFRELLDLWPSDLFEISSITTAINDQIKADNVRKSSEDWALLQECLAKLYLADGHYEDALKCYITLQDADTAMTLMKEHHLIDAIADDIPSFVLLRIVPSQINTMPREELEDLSSDSIKILVDEATRGIVEIDDVVAQLQTPKLKVFLFFYLRALWRGQGTKQQQAASGNRGRGTARDLASDEGKTLVEAYADTAVELFAEYDRQTLMAFLHVSTSYTYEKALKICEKRDYIEEQVYLLSKTGAMKKALYLIIDKLQDVSTAISFAKEQDDPGLWNDFLEYSMSRPKFISGLLAEVGTAIDPIELIRRIPSGLEVEGLKDGLMKMLREHDIQDSISTGAAKVLSSEVAAGMNTLRRGRQQGIKFDVPKAGKPTPVPQPQSQEGAVPASANEPTEMTTEPEILPGRCAGCHKAFTPHETETLIGFACGHVYHVPHLFHEPGEADNEHELSLPKLHKTNDDEEESSTSEFVRTIAPKVTSARLLKDKVEDIGGCKICKRVRDSVPGS